MGTPPLYGVDAVHGHGNVPGATIFPHQIGLGATRDADLVRHIGEITAQEIVVTEANWNFSPNVDYETNNSLFSKKISANLRNWFARRAEI